MNKDALKRRIKLLRYNKISTILDIGANTGQYAYYTRKAGYQNRIISFEPLSEAYHLLDSFAQRDPQWDVVKAAIGDKDGEIIMNISQNLQSSSILEIMDSHLDAAPESAYKGKEKVKIFKIDSIVNEYTDNLDTTFLKIDTQGYEKHVLSGAEETLKQIKGLRLELSFVELYQGETLFREMVNYVMDMGFTICSVEPGFNNTTTGQLLQTDVVFYRL